MAKITIIGTIEKIGKTQSVGEKGFTKRALLLDETSNPKYPKKIYLEFQKDKTSLLDSFQPNQEVTIKAEISSREYEQKFFTQIVGYEISLNHKASKTQSPQQTPDPNDDLPF